LALSALIGIVWFAGVVKIKVSFDPLTELEVILIFGLHKLVDLNMPLDSILIECATGSIYCQIMDAIYPGSFNFAKVKWGAKFDYEYVENYKIL